MYDQCCYIIQISDQGRSNTHRMQSVVGHSFDLHSIQNYIVASRLASLKAGRSALWYGRLCRAPEVGQHTDVDPLVDPVIIYFWWWISGPNKLRCASMVTKTCTHRKNRLPVLPFARPSREPIFFPKNFIDTNILQSFSLRTCPLPSPSRGKCVESWAGVMEVHLIVVSVVT